MVNDPDHQPAVPPADPEPVERSSGPPMEPGPPPPPPPGPADTGVGRPRSGRGRPWLTALVVVALMLGAGLAGALTARAIDDDEPGTTGPIPFVDADGDDAPAGPLSRAADAVLPSVVSITIDSDAGTGQGSGVVISDDGLILTNNHVVGPAAQGELTVTTSDGTTASATVMGADQMTDLAVIQADLTDLTPANFGDSSVLEVGTEVLAVGSPLGLEGSVTSGIVSALNRPISLRPTGDGTPGGGATGPPTVIDAIQTDAAINPGNSGGALANTDGQVVGINTAIASLAGQGGGGPGGGGPGGNIGVGFAIPINAARDIADQLVNDGKVTHAYLGVRIADAPNGGATVGGVDEESPAADAGLRQGDLIIGVDDEAISDAAALTANIRMHRPEDKITLTYERDGAEDTVDVALGTLPE